ncbi:MAG: iron uptake transporter deferrochelatase/peroxidase subunit [Candidatus Nanopelagicales bacterium]|nr:iron uptake transporter deferrochelatase/peroxidase subunit [Candidatus Nanopelagicales bacterium]
MTEVDERNARGFSRRALLGAFGAGALTVAGAGTATALVVGRAPSAHPASAQYPFHGAVQQGVTTPMQRSLHFAALDITTTTRDAVITMLQRWSAAAAAMTTGQPIGGTRTSTGGYDAPPDDSGEAMDLATSGLTITVGFGPTLFRDVAGHDRFGLAGQQPSCLHELPHFPGDQVDPLISSGDLCIQACADDPQVAVHAVRNLVRIAFGTATVRWTQAGFGASSSTSTEQPTPRNLFGFKDGTNNIMGGDQAALDDYVWVQPADEPQWMAGGTYLAVRKIRMILETWDRTSLREQEGVFGRTRSEGAPLSGGDEFTTVDLAATGRGTDPLVPADSHLAVAHPSSNNGVRILRRAYNYTAGSDRLGRIDAGLFFLAFVRDLDTQFIPMQMRLSRSDRMNEYVRYQSSAAFAIPSGLRGPDDWFGRALFEATA